MNKTHGHTVNREMTRTYRIWNSMVNRGRGTANRKYYAERGITVCERWQSFENFLHDMGEAPDGLSIERINNDAGYSPDNCCWASCMEQANNRRSNRLIEHDGRRMTQAEWARQAGISRQALRYRLASGWGMEHALSIRPHHGNKTPGLDQNL